MSLHVQSVSGLQKKFFCRKKKWFYCLIGNFSALFCVFFSLIKTVKEQIADLRSTISQQDVVHLHMLTPK